MLYNVLRFLKKFSMTLVVLVKYFHQFEHKIIFNKSISAGVAFTEEKTKLSHEYSSKNNCLDQIQC